MTPGTAPQTGGRCAQHPDRPSTSTCTRCGSFMCQTCSAGGAEVLCPPCRQRTGAGVFPYHRDDFSFDRLWGYTFEAWKKQWVMLSVAVLALGAIYFMGSFILQIFMGGGTAILGRAGSRESAGAVAGIVVFFFIGLMVLLMVIGIGFIGLLRMCCDVLLGKTADFGVLFSQFSKTGRALALLFMMWGITMIPLIAIGGSFGGLAYVLGPSVRDIDSGTGGAAFGGMFALIAFGYLAVIVAIIYITLPFTFAMLELAHSDAGAVECLKRGYSLAKGFRLQIFAYRLLGGLIGMVGMLACCVGILPAYALAFMLETSLYLAIRNGSGLPPLNLE